MPRVKHNVAADVARVAKSPVAGEGESRLLLPTGSTLLNLAVSDNALGGWGAGKVVNLVGDSDTGKTVLALTGVMEMTLDDKWKDYRLIYDDAENALAMDVAGMFGPALAKRLEDPAGHRLGSSKWESSLTIEDFRNNVWKRLEAGEPFVYVLDSYDGVTTRDELARQEKEIKGTELNRDYPRGPAVLTETLRKITSAMKRTESLLIVVSQTRDVMDPVGWGAQKRRAGGKALKFFSSHEVWMAIDGTLKRDIAGKKYSIGRRIRVRSERSKLNGKRREVEMAIYYDYGIDDTGSCVDWLMAEGFWKGTRAAVDTRGFVPDKLTRSELIEVIEDGHRVRDLRRLVGEKWAEREDALKLDRPRRYET